MQITNRPDCPNVPTCSTPISTPKPSEQTCISRSRYFDALAVVDDPAPAYGQLRQLIEPKVVDGAEPHGL
jgi:hypothetical protein